MRKKQILYNRGLHFVLYFFPQIGVKIAKQNGALPQENQHLANQVRLQLPSDEVNDQTIATTVIEAMPHYDQLL